MILDRVQAKLITCFTNGQAITLSGVWYWLLASLLAGFFAL